MPRYHFNVYDGSSNLDHEGVELRDLDQAHIEALRFTAGIISDEARRRSSARNGVSKLRTLRERSSSASIY